jgi:DNA-binding MarR family transcriptional regulator
MVRVSEYPSPEAAIERAILRIRRRQSRKSLSTLVRSGELSKMSLISPALLSVLDTVEELNDEAVPATTTAVATRMEIDQPRASRLVAKAVARGYLERRGDESDGRRSLLIFTEAGADFMAGVHRFRRRVVSNVLSEWPEEQRRLFASLLTEFVEIADRRRLGGS